MPVLKLNLLARAHHYTGPIRARSLTNMSLRDEKKALRKFMKERLAKMTEEEVMDQCSEALFLMELPEILMCRLASRITAEVLNLPAYQKARRISAFLSMPSREVSTYEIVLHAIDDGKTVFVPYIHQNRTNTSQKPASVMDMLALHSKEDLESLKPDAWGIPTLDEGSVASRENALSGHGIDNVVPGANRAPESSHGLGLDFMLVPGVAFDMENRRLGHGKGFYDRYLQRYKDIVASRSEARMPRLGKNWSASREMIC
jgi:5-formyltetrahydrofolate cyclo-ligase